MGVKEKKSKQLNSNQQQHQNAHFSPFKFAKLVDPDASWDKNEVACLSKMNHQNVISLLGYCIHGDTRFLVYEMMHNGSLESQLHGPSRGSALTWHLRMRVALDVARGLEFLHERCNPPVIHRDIKSSNILLDSNFNAKEGNQTSESAATEGAKPNARFEKKKLYELRLSLL